MDYTKESLEVLRTTYGYEQFREHQMDIINDILNNRDRIAVLPTGYGKSLLFQIPPMVGGGLGVIISPLIALMMDQKMRLDSLGVSSCCYNSTLTLKQKRTIEKELINGEYQIMYTTPESFMRMGELMEQVRNNIGICCVAIDEAHCISSYGFDFRPSYRDLANIRKILPNIPILAVTATATQQVIDDIVKVMGIKPNITKISFDRPNIRIMIEHQEQKEDNTLFKIGTMVQNLKKGSSIVYCLTKNDTEKVAEYLSKMDIGCRAYHSGLSDKLRRDTQEDFMNNKIKCIVATIAFGMGIDKSDIRLVVHFGCPQNIESYYQEIGRAGRDGEKSECLLLYKERDFMIQKRFIESIQDPIYRATRLKLLNTMSQFTKLKTCRRQYLLEYFGEKSDKCNNCCNCSKEKADIRTINKKDHMEISSIVQLSEELRYGALTLGLILKGSGSKKINDRMKRSKFYGSMCNRSIDSINMSIRKAVDLGYLESYDIGNCIHVVQPSKEGRELITKSERLISTLHRDLIHSS